MDIFSDATAVSEAIRAKEISSSEVLDSLLTRIGTHNGSVNAVVALDVERARARAGAADEAAARGEWWGPLHGLPMTVKDSYETEGLVTTSGAPELPDHVPISDAAAVAKLKAAGVIVFGKTNLPLYAGDVQSSNEVYGTTNNPWSLDRTPGGSSGGAAAALATGMTPLELGSDIGGSIRIPASFCGVVGIKPSFRVVPIRGHVPGPPGALRTTDISVAGPMARSVRDLVTALDVLAGPEDSEASAWSLNLPPPRSKELSSLRIGAAFDHEDLRTSSAVRASLTSATEVLAKAGAKIEDATAARPLIGEGVMLSHLVTAAIANGFPAPVLEFADAVEATPVAPDETRETRALRAMGMRHRTWLQWDERRHQLRSRWAEWFTDHDVLLTPTFAVTAFPHDHSPLATRTMDVDGRPETYFQNTWCTTFGVAYLPAACVPAGFTEAGLPVGLQIVGPYLEDRTVLAAAAAIEEVLGGFTPPPAYRE